MDYRQMLRDHVDKNADITLSVLPCGEEEIAGFGAVRVDDAGKVIEFREKPATAEARDGMAIGPELRVQRNLHPEKPYLASMGIYIFKKDMLARCLANELVDFGKDIIPRAAQKFNVQAHFFNGYWRDIGTIESFYQTHMDLLRDDPPFSFDDESWPFYTLPRYLPGSKLDGTSFTRTILSEGTRVVRSTIEHSIIGVAAQIRNATIRRSLVMGTDAPLPKAPTGAPPIGIGEGTLIEKAIVDKNARIGRNVDIADRGDREHDAEGPGWAIRDGIVVISKNAIVPDGTRI
jgi:glucose-1-phosphate adenylyltransferase